MGRGGRRDFRDLLAPPGSLARPSPPPPLSRFASRYLGIAPLPRTALLLPMERREVPAMYPH